MAKVERCSFCNKTKAEVKHLIQGKKAFICDTCARTCKQLLEAGAREGAVSEKKDEEGSNVINMFDYSKDDDPGAA